MPAIWSETSSLKNLENELANKGFVRCHRSYIVNFERVSIVRKEKDGLVLELDTVSKKALPVSETYVDEVMILFSRYSGV